MGKGYDEAGIERYIFVATLDAKTSEVCAELDGKSFDRKDAKPGTNYPPMHPFCRSTTIADFGEDTLKGLERRAKDENGNTVKVPASQSYEEWYKQNVSEKERLPLDKSVGSGIMEREREFGVQYGALSITADKDFISSKEYANLFSNITNNRAVNDSIADLSCKAILHRNGSKYEDMYIVNANTGEVMGQQLDMQYPSGISYNDSIKSALSRAKEANIPIIAIHNHPEGYPPSIDDFNKAYDNNYFLGIACGHNGQVYVYDKPEFRIAQTDADEIHEAMNLLIDQGADPDRIYREYYNELGLSYRIEKGGSDNVNS